PMHVAPKHDLCPRCGNPLTDIELNFHASVGNPDGTPGTDIHGLKGYCVPCHLPFTRLTQGKKYDSGWVSCSLKKEDLGKQLGESELLKVEEIVRRYKSASSKWETFLSYRQDADKFFLYESLDYDSGSVVMVRGEEPVLSFPVHAYLFRKLK
ncbi:MAG: hypothetical protein AAFV07_16260, partial [Bacteroidota bacterium]